MLPKGFDATTFRFDPDRERKGFCTYGTAYLARAALARTYSRSRVTVAQLSLPFAELPDRLNDFAAGVVCHLVALRRGWKFGVALNRIRRGSLLRLRSGVEPMIKNFEIPGCGAALVCDYIPELEDLGFVDGENAIFYRTINELIDIVRTGDTDRLRQVGAAGARLVHSRHTWQHRAEDLVTALPRWLDNPTG
jgi:Glycosyl transferases group 1